MKKKHEKSVCSLGGILVQQAAFALLACEGMKQIHRGDYLSLSRQLFYKMLVFYPLLAFCKSLLGQELCS